MMRVFLRKEGGGKGLIEHYLESETPYCMLQERKPTYLIVLLFISFFLLSFLVFFIFYLNRYGVTPLVRVVILLLGIMSSFLLLVFLLGIVVTILALQGKPPRGFLQGILKLVISRIIPLVMRWGTLVGLDGERLEGTFIQLTNSLGKEGWNLGPEGLLVLVPHCAQHSSCTVRITHDVTNCQQCGGCQIGDLLHLKERYGFLLKVVNGGTQARSVIGQCAPEGIVAVACERDLSSGIMDTFPLPVYGVINIRPEGPCFNTRIPLEEMEEGIRLFLRREVL